MLNLDQLVSQKIHTQLNRQINDSFNAFIKENPLPGQLLAFCVIFGKCVLHTIAILANTLEYAFRGLIDLLTSQGSAKEYFTTLGSFLVINTMNALTIIPDIFIRTYYTIQDSTIHPSHTKHTLYYKILGVKG